MENNTQPPGSGPPRKPWEVTGTSSSGPAPFRPPSAGNTSEVVEASGTAQPGEVVSTDNSTVAINRNSLARPVPNRPWQQQTYGNTYGGGYGSGLNYSSGYGSGMTGSYGGFGGNYGGGLYGNNMYRGGYGGVYGGGMYGGGMNNGAFGGPMGGYGMGMGIGGPNGEDDPNNPFGPASPPSFWISLMRVMHGVVTFFGRVAFLIDQNTQAFHMFMTALLQLFDRSGLLYGELARFVFRLLGLKTKPKKMNPPGSEGHTIPGNRNVIEGSKPAAPSGSWDTVWGNSN